MTTIRHVAARPRPGTPLTGFRWRLAGASERASHYAGVSRTRSVFGLMLTCGVLSGVAGAIEVDDGLDGELEVAARVAGEHRVHGARAGHPARGAGIVDDLARGSIDGREEGAGELVVTEEQELRHRARDAHDAAAHGARRYGGGRPASSGGPRRIQQADDFPRLGASP